MSACDDVTVAMATAGVSLSACLHGSSEVLRPCYSAVMIYLKQLIVEKFNV